MSNATSSSSHATTSRTKGLIFLTQLLRTHFHEWLLKFPVTTISNGKIFHDIFELLEGKQIVHVPSESRLKERLVEPWYIGDDFPRFRALTQHYLKFFPSVDVVSEPRPLSLDRLYCVIIDNNPRSPMNVSVQLHDAGVKYWMTWVEKLLLICLVCFVDDSIDFSQPKEIPLPPAVKGFLVYCKTASKGKEVLTGGETFNKRFTFFLPILDINQWEHLSLRGQTDAHVEKDRKRQIMLAFSILAYHSLVKYDRNMKFGLLRVMLANRSKPYKALYYERTFRKLSRDECDREQEEAHTRAVSQANLIESYLEDGEKDWFEQNKYGERHKYLQLYIRHMWTESTYRNRMQRLLSTMSLEGIRPHKVTWIDIHALKYMLTRNNDFVTLDLIRNEMKKEEDWCFCFVPEHLAIVLNDYIHFMIQVMVYSDVDEKEYGIILDVFNSVEGEVQVLVAIPRVLFMLVNYAGCALSLYWYRYRQNIPFMNVDGEGLIPMILQCIDPLRKTYPSQESTDTGMYYPVLAFLRLILHADPILNVQRSKLMLGKHAQLFALIVRFLMKKDEHGKMLVDRMVHKIPLQQVLFIWLVIPFTTVLMEEVHKTRVIDKMGTVVSAYETAMVCFKAGMKTSESTNIKYVKETFLKRAAVDKCTHDIFTSDSTISRRYVEVSETDTRDCVCKWMFSLLTSPNIECLEDIAFSLLCWVNIKLNIPSRMYQRLFPVDMIKHWDISEVSTKWTRDVHRIGYGPLPVTDQPVNASQSVVNSAISMACGFGPSVSSVAIATQSLVRTFQIPRMMWMDHSLESTLFVPPFIRLGETVDPTMTSLLEGWSIRDDEMPNCPLFSEVKSPLSATGFKRMRSPEIELDLLHTNGEDETDVETNTSSKKINRTPELTPIPDIQRQYTASY